MDQACCSIWGPVADASGFAGNSGTSRDAAHPENHVVPSQDPTITPAPSAQIQMIGIDRCIIAAVRGRFKTMTASECRGNRSISHDGDFGVIDIPRNTFVGKLDQIDVIPGRRPGGATMSALPEPAQHPMEEGPVGRTDHGRSCRVRGQAPGPAALRHPMTPLLPRRPTWPARPVAPTYFLNPWPGAFQWPIVYPGKGAHRSNREPDRGMS